MRPIFSRQSNIREFAVTPERAPATPPPARAGQQRTRSWLAGCLFPAAQARAERAEDTANGAAGQPRIVAAATARSRMATSAPASPLNTRPGGVAPAAAASPPRRAGPASFAESLNVWRTQMRSSRVDFRPTMERPYNLPLSAENFNQRLEMAAAQFQAVQRGNSRKIEIVGGPAMRLPESLGSLTMLDSLHLISCDVRQLPDSLGQLSGLTTLHLTDNPGLQRLPDSFSNLGNLQNLTLHDTGLTALPPLGNLHNLKVLDLGRSPLRTLPSELGRLEQLQELRIARCDNLVSIPVAIGQINGLTKLDLHANTGLSELPREIGQLTNLQKLNLNGCTALRSLPTSVGNLRNLRVLDLRGCTQLTRIPDGVLQLPASCVIKLPAHLASLRSPAGLAPASPAARTETRLSVDEIVSRIEKKELRPVQIVHLGREHAQRRASTYEGQLRELKKWPGLHAFARNHDSVSQKIMELAFQDMQKLEEAADAASDDAVGTDATYLNAYNMVHAGWKLALEGQEANPRESKEKIIGRYETIAADWLKPDGASSSARADG
jgi:hypothetical protein